MSESVRLIYEDDKTIVAYKLGNVGVRKGEKVFRETGPDIYTWYEKTKNNNVNFRILTELETPFAGLFIIKRDKDDRELKVSHTQLTSKYVGIVRGNISSSVSNDEGFIIRPKQSCSSLSHGMVTLVELHSPYPVNPRKVCSHLEKIGHPVIGTISPDISSPFLSLIGIQFPKNYFNSTNKNVPNDTIEVDIPKKFLKFMNRENINYQRFEQIQLQNKNMVIDPEEIHGADSNKSHLDETACIQATFRGLTFQVPSTDLIPRESSGVLVEETLQILEKLHAGPHAEILDGQVPRPFKILDLGCGVGTLLLSVLRESSRSCGVGLDIDSRALQTAKLNQMYLLGSGSTTTTTPPPAAAVEGRCRFILGDFSNLLSIRDKLNIAPDSGEEQGFDVIISNPPYLSEKAAQSRFTSESKRVLVSGPTGTEAYEVICKSIIACERAGRRLLRPGGALIFQVPGGASGDTRVKKVLGEYGFKGFRTRLDARGIKRCVICTRD